MAYMRPHHEEDPRDVIYKKLGDISNIEIFNNQIIVATYVRPSKTKGGIILPGSVGKEDEIQSKVGLVIKKGPTAFIDETGKWFDGITVELNDWVVFRPSDGWAITVGNAQDKDLDVACRVLDDTSVRGRVQFPDQVY